MTNPTGYTALDMVGYTDKGDYSSIKTYVKNDLTNYNGIKWRCLIDDTTDVTPTEGLNWTKFVEYGDYVNEVEYEEDIYGVNLIPYPYRDAPPKTSYGVTFTAGSNGAIVANGTNDGTRTSEYYFIRILGSELKSLMKNQPCILSGCPSGGTLESYRLNFSRTDSWETVKTDTGEGVTILPSDIEDSVQYIIRILITRNYTVPTNLTFKPMLRKATIQDDTYRPYNQQSIQHQLTEQTNVLGVKNLLPNKATTQVIGGVTYTVRADGSVVCSGTTSTGWNPLHLLRYSDKVMVKKGTYILSGCTDGSSLSYRLSLFISPSGSSDDEQQENSYDRPIIVNIPEDSYIRAYISGLKTDVPMNTTFYPMLRLASDPDNTYVPYAMTNRELTEKKINLSDLKTVVSSSSDFEAFKTAIANL